ncbi:hypothetical protein Q2941_37075 [Bradyrhizobium sp. UFLA05-153]
MSDRPAVDGGGPLLSGWCRLVKKIQCGIDLLDLLIDLFPLLGIVSGAELRAFPSTSVDSLRRSTVGLLLT